MGLKSIANSGLQSHKIKNTKYEFVGRIKGDVGQTKNYILLLICNSNEIDTLDIRDKTKQWFKEVRKRKMGKNNQTIYQHLNHICDGKLGFKPLNKRTRGGINYYSIERDFDTFINLIGYFDKQNKIFDFFLTKYFNEMFDECFNMISSTLNMELNKSEIKIIKNISKVSPQSLFFLLQIAFAYTYDKHGIVGDCMGRLLVDKRAKELSDKELKETTKEVLFQSLVKFFYIDYWAIRQDFSIPEDVIEKARYKTYKLRKMLNINLNFKIPRDFDEEILNKKLILYELGGDNKAT